MEKEDSVIQIVVEPEPELRFGNGPRPDNGKHVLHHVVPSAAPLDHTSSLLAVCLSGGKGDDVLWLADVHRPAVAILAALLTVIRWLS